MSPTNLVRPSRDGDQFHYFWAARRCLLLLPPDAALKAVTIEGSSPFEAAEANRITPGEQLIDVGEYYGSETLEQATLIRYIQLKHSTQRVEEAWPPSGLEQTLAGFAARYRELIERLNRTDLFGKLEFWFVSNRPISTDFLEAVHDTAEGIDTSHPAALEKLKRFTSLSGPALVSFCKLLRLQGGEGGLWDQRNILAQDVSHYLPDADVDAPVQLKELVTRKALSESQENPAITRMDVLRALKSDESRLFPAPCLIKALAHPVPRQQEPELFLAIRRAEGTPVVVHAAGGVGKSVFATRISYGLPAGSVTVLYDCFGNGQYRSPSGYRHRHKDALVQIANELAGKGLCHPLIPTPHADAADYVRVFVYRLRQCIASLRTRNAEAVLCVVIDAADNAQIAAEDAGEARSFVRDLIRERLPEGLRLVTLCRTHRQADLSPPPSALRLELLPFSRSETAAHLRQVFPEATEQDLDEFHRLTSHNPRVQALALEREAPLSEILRGLGPNPTTVEAAIGDLLNAAIRRLRDAAGALEKEQIDRICFGLAVLRPQVPLSVLASMSEVDEAAIESFAYDLGRPLLVTGDAIQFFDEPAETWFRETFRPSAGVLAGFVASLKPLAGGSAYVASALPQLMLEVGQVGELVSLALSSDALPSTNPIERRDVEVQRLQFALKASLRANRYSDAAKLALRAGGESAGDERQRRLLQAHTDLAAAFLQSGRIQDLVSRRAFGSGWVGSHHAYEAGLLSGKKPLLGEARSRLRMAREWLRNWSRLPKDEREQEEVTNNDILEMATAFFNIYGAASCADDLRRWKPREISFRVGRALARRLVDHSRFDDLDDLAVAAGNDLYLVLAITQALGEVQRTPPRRVVERALRLSLNRRVELEVSDHWDHEATAIQAVTALAEASHKLSVGNKDMLIAVLTRYLPSSPPRGLSSRHGGLRFPLLRAYALRAALGGQSLNLGDLAHEELRKELEHPKPHSESQEVREFKAVVGALLPWHRLWAAALIDGAPFDLGEAISRTMAESSRADKAGYRDESNTTDEIAHVWFDTLFVEETADASTIDVFNQWVAGLKRPLFTTTLAHLARLAGRIPSLEEYALGYAHRAFEIVRAEREHAEPKSDSLVALSRAVLSVSRSEAAAFFNEGLDVASRIGDENLDRWGALLDLADRAACREKPVPEMAYRLARCAELTYEYVLRDKHFDWGATVRAIAGLCGRSSIAILSRWRDRAFGRANRLLPAAVTFLVARGDLDPKVALALIAFRFDWDEPQLLKAVLSICTMQAERKATTEFTYRYMTLEQQSAKKWNDLKETATAHGLAPDDLDRHLAVSENRERASKANERSWGSGFGEVGESSRECDWNTIFENADLAVANDISRAYQRFRDSAPPYYAERFFEEAFHRVDVGKEAEFIQATADASNLELYHLRALLEGLPESWKNRLAVKPALAQTLTTFCRRFCMEIHWGRYYEELPFRTACELAGIEEGHLVDVVLAGIGEATEVVGPSRLFSLVGLLARKLNQIEAREALSFGLDLFDKILEDKDGDGPWSPKLAPPAEIEDALAGYIWGCLAAPRASLRWEAAHVVRAMCELGHRKVLSHLVALANGATAEAFVDARFSFYELHARQWLLIGLARATRERPDLVVSHADFLIKLAIGGEPHVLIREFAKRTILALLDRGFLVSQADLRHRLSTVNASPLPFVESKHYPRIEDEGRADDEASASTDDDRFFFGIDIGPYWLAPLGRCFAKSQAGVEREALRVIRGDWQLSGGQRWDEDERHRRKIFRDGETYHSHGSYPPVDDLRFYLSYHAMMVVAGKLLATTPVHRDPDNPHDDFHYWHKGHDLTREDGAWLSDRRDPIPFDIPEWKGETEMYEWRWSVTRNDFDRVLIGPDSRINLWGGWTWISGHREESVHVRSALVSSDRSLALLRALQSTDNPHDYRIPDAEDQLQIDFQGYRLRGWIADPMTDARLDGQDPWAGSIRFPPPAPAAYIIELMNLSPDAERRRWSSPAGMRDVAWSQAWGNFSEGLDNEERLESGSRFQVSFPFVIALLRKLRMDLIVEVEIERHWRQSRWETRKDEYRGFIPPSARLFLFKADGTYRTL